MIGGRQGFGKGFFKGRRESFVLSKDAGQRDKLASIMFFERKARPALRKPLKGNVGVNLDTQTLPRGIDEMRADDFDLDMIVAHVIDGFDDFTCAARPVF